MALNNQKNLLQAPAAKRKGAQNETAILQFLLKEKYSTARVLTVLLGFADRSSILKVLKRMADKRWIKSHQFDRLTKLYGITQSGIHEAQRHCDVITDWKYFEPSKVNPNTLLHQLMVQEVHALCVRLGLKFVTGKAIGSRANQDKIPDGEVHFPDKVVALEVERHIKSKRRYDAIVYNYLKLIKAGKYDSVLYVSDDDAMARRIKKAITSLETITMTVNGRKQKLMLKPEVHFSYFDFVGLKYAYQYYRDNK